MKEIEILGEGHFSKVIKFGTKVLKILKNKLNNDELTKNSKRELNCHFYIKKYLKDNPNLSPEVYKNILVIDGYFGSHSDQVKSIKDFESVIGGKFDVIKNLIKQEFKELEIFYFDYYQYITLNDYINNSNVKFKELFLKSLPNSYRKIDNLKITRDILQGLDFLHKLSISHHDLKGDNIILVNDNNQYYAKIIDFGLATHPNHISNNESYITCGTISYMSPEKLNISLEKNESCCYDAYKSDIWSVGIILYLLCNLKFPFSKAHKSDSMYQLFLNNNYDLENMEEYENNIISLMLQEDIEKRSSINNIINQINYIIDFKEKQYKTKKISILNHQSILENNSSFGEHTPNISIQKKRKMESDENKEKYSRKEIIF